MPSYSFIALAFAAAVQVQGAVVAEVFNRQSDLAPRGLLDPLCPLLGTILESLCPPAGGGGVVIPTPTKPGTPSPTPVKNPPSTNPLDVSYCRDTGLVDCLSELSKPDVCTNVKSGFEDQISSFVPPTNNRCVLYKDTNCKGDSHIVGPKASVNLVSERFNDIARSFRCSVAPVTTGPIATPTPSVPNIPFSLTDAYYCQDTQFGGTCKSSTTVPHVCVVTKDVGGISSIAPPSKNVCVLYSNSDCSGDSYTVVNGPNANLVGTKLNDNVKSINCFPPSVSGRSL